MTPAFPLTAIVAMESLVEALLVNAVAPGVGGVLVRGERGTAKSTAVRALAPLLPPVQAAAGQRYCFAPGEDGPDGPVAADAGVVERPAPLVELPLGTTLDRLVGALDLGRALAGERAFEAGLLARAHQGILYVDEVNLLPDHLVDALLDAAATGIARVEREAVSAQHAARFVLVGTMNVEEGELRPQLLDRFGLGVEARAPAEPAQRAEIVRRRLAFEHDPEAFAARWAGAEDALAARIAAARARLADVRLPERELLRITGACARLGVDGVRGDIVCARAARALAALDGASEVTEEHVRRAAALALHHRRRRDPLDGRAPAEQDLERALDDDGPPDDEPHPPAPPPRGNGGAPQPGAPAPDRPARERRDPPAPARLPLGAVALHGSGAGPSGRRARTRGPAAGTVDSRPAASGGGDLAVVASLRAGELREHVRSGREAALVCLVVDASGSMGARRRLARVKGALIALLGDAYARRDRVALIAFRDSAAELLLTPGAPIERAAAAIRALPTGGRTPLAAGLDAATQLIRRERLREPGRRAIAIVLTDGRVADPEGAIARAAAGLGRAAAAVHVVDTEDGPVRLGLAAAVAAAAGGELHELRSAA
ncbi:MAG: magnesium chelatase subunit [Solirubrobacteraceae bacterium]|nr:magnesium chelatase subunit [Solirubrobacteraceae bacterium]